MKTMNFHHFLVLDIEDAEFEFSSTQQDATTTHNTIYFSSVFFILRGKKKEEKIQIYEIEKKEGINGNRKEEE